MTHVDPRRPKMTQEEPMLRFTAPEKKDINNDTLNIVAATQNGVLKRVQDIIEGGEWHVNTPDEQDVPLLHWSAINNRQEIALYLIGRGANVSAIGGILRENALHWATRQGHLAMIVLLVRHGADWTVQNKDGYTPLHISAQFQLTSLCAYYLALGADCDIPNNAGKTPLMLAISKLNVPDPTRLFLSMGASVSARDKDGNTALHLAVKQCNGTVTNLLLEKGADMYSYNNEGETAKQIAQIDHSNWILKLMKEKDKEERIMDVFTKRIPILLLGGYPGIGMGLIGYILTCDLPYMLPFVYIVMVALVQILLLRLCLSRNSENPLPIGIYFGITAWLYATLYYQLSSYYFDFISALFFTMVIFLHLYSFNKTWWGDPGFLGSDYDAKRKDIIRLAESGKFDMSRFCTTCVVRRPVRSKHCTVCNKCVAKFDHHCPFVGNCIGATNHKWFILYLVTITIQLIIYCLATYEYYSTVCYRPDNTWAGALYIAMSCSPWLTWFSSLALIFLVWVTCLLVMQLNQIIVLGITTNEFYNVARYNYLQADCVGCTKVHSPFSFGWKQNISDFLEYKLPCLPSPQRYNWFNLYTWGNQTSTRPQSPTSKLKRSVSLSSIV